MRDKQGEQIVAAIDELRRRGGLLGVGVRALDDAGTDAFAACLGGLGIEPDGVTKAQTPAGVPFRVWIPNRRREHGVMLVPDSELADAGTLDALCLTAHDLLAVSEADQTMQEYCGYLGQSYENMAMVYRLVRSMGDITSASQIVEESLRNMTETLECGWVAAVFGNDSELLGDLVGRVFSASDREPGRDFEADARELLTRWGGEDSVVVTPERNGGLAVVIQPIRLRSQIVGKILMVGKNDESGDVSSFDTQLLDAVAACISSLLETIKLYAEQSATFMGTLQALSSSLDAKDRYTRGHSERVALLAKSIALGAGLGRETADRYELAGQLHDIGKIGVPDRVLCKPGKLDDDEFGLIKRHPRIGYEILRPIPAVRDILPGVLHHHERWDGRGYPDRLEGEAIDPMARALAIADTFDAMSSNRAYRSARSRDEVLTEIEKCRGSQFDPDLAGVFLSIDLAPFDALLAKHGSEKVNEQDADGSAGLAA